MADEVLRRDSQDWANTKAAYRFLSNAQVGEAEILAGHFQATGSRAASVDDLILVLQDTTEFTYKRADPEQIGAIGLTPVGRGLHGHLELRTVRGLSAQRLDELLPWSWKKARVEDPLAA